MEPLRHGPASSSVYAVSGSGRGVDLRSGCGCGCGRIRSTLEHAEGNRWILPTPSRKPLATCAGSLPGCMAAHRRLCTSVHLAGSAGGGAGRVGNRIWPRHDLRRSTFGFPPVRPTATPCASLLDSGALQRRGHEHRHSAPHTLMLLVAATVWGAPAATSHAGTTAGASAGLLGQRDQRGQVMNRASDHSMRRPALRAAADPARLPAKHVELIGGPRVHGSSCLFARLRRVL